MPQLTPGQIIDALARGVPNQLLGCAESEQVDFKLAPYQLTDEKQKWELAKDAAAFANKRGGLIVIGVECRREVNEISEVACTIRPVSKTTTTLQQYRDIIDAWIYPRIDGVDVRWYPPEAEQLSGVLVVEIPAQNDREAPFIVRSMRETGGEFRGAVGVPRRDRDRVVWDTAADLHRRIAGARSEAQLGPGAITEILVRATTRVNELERVVGWDQMSVYFLQALPPPGPATLNGFYDELRQAVANHHTLRPGGFAWWNTLRDEALESGWLCRNSESLLWLEPDGLVTQGFPVTEDSNLAWYYNEDRAEGAPLILHPVAVLETTLEFFRFMHTEVRPRAARGLWRYRILCRRFRSHRVALPTGRPDRARLHIEPPSIASSDEWNRTFDDSGTASRDAFEALSRFYALFGYAPAAIPLSHDNSVSEEELVRVG